RRLVVAIDVQEDARPMPGGMRDEKAQLDPAPPAIQRRLGVPDVTQSVAVAVEVVAHGADGTPADVHRRPLSDGGEQGFKSTHRLWATSRPDPAARPTAGRSAPAHSSVPTFATSLEIPRGYAPFLQGTNAIDVTLWRALGCSLPRSRTSPSPTR